MSCLGVPGFLMGFGMEPYGKVVERFFYDDAEDETSA